MLSFHKIHVYRKVKAIKPEKMRVKTQSKIIKFKKNCYLKIKKNYAYDSYQINTIILYLIFILKYITSEETQDILE